MKAVVRPGGGDSGPSDGDQVISVFPRLWIYIFLIYI